MKLRKLKSFKITYVLIFILIFTHNFYAVVYANNLGEAPIIKKALINTRESITIVKMDRNRKISDIVSMAKKLTHSAFDSDKVTKYATVPNFTAPYFAGSLDSDDINDALNTVKMVRYISGLPYENIKFTTELNNISQHGATLLAASNQFTHYPVKPADMDDDFFNLGYRGCDEANISAGMSNISNSVLAGFVADGGSNNIGAAGHRRWVLKPGAESFGIGYARNTAPGISYQGDRVSMHVQEGLNYWECEADTYIAWPSSGDFPIQYFIADNNLNTVAPYPWSINLGYEYSAPVRDEIVLTLTRNRDNKSWVFDKNTPQLGINNMPDNSMHLAVDDIGYGITKAIIFRPDLTTLGTIKAGDVFTVNVSGIKDSAGQSTTLNYDINFFDLEYEMNKKVILNPLVDDIHVEALYDAELLPNEVASISLDIKATKPTTRVITAFSALYNEKGVLIKVEGESIVPTESIQTVNFSFALPDEIEGYKLKTFIWDQGGIPVTDIVVM